MTFWRNLFSCKNKLSYGEYRIMTELEKVTARQMATLAAIKEVDGKVEALFDKIKELTGNGVSEEASAILLAQQDEIDAELAKVTSDD